MNTDDSRVAARCGAVDCVAHNVAVILFPDPALGCHIRAGHELQKHVCEVGWFCVFGQVERRTLWRLIPWAVIIWRVVSQWCDRDVADHFAVLLQHETACVSRHADDFSVEVPFVEDRFGDGFLARLENHEHTLLAFRQHDFVGCHAFFALRHFVEIHLNADTFAILAAAVCHLDRRGGEASRAHILNGLNGVSFHQLEAGFDKKFLGEWVANLNGWAFLFVTFGEFCRRHCRAVNTVAAGFGANIEDRVARRCAACVENLVPIGETHSHSVDEDVAVIASVKLGFASNRRNADTVTIAANTVNNARHQRACFRVVRLAKAQCVDQCNRARAHCEYIAQDTTNTCRRALIRLDVRRVVVALHFEDRCLTVANIDDTSILARALNDELILCREFGEVTA